MNQAVIGDILSSLVAILFVTLLNSFLIGHIIAIFPSSKGGTHRQRFDRVWPITASVMVVIEIILHVFSLIQVGHMTTAISILLLGPLLSFLMIKLFSVKK